MVTAVRSSWLLAVAAMWLAGDAPRCAAGEEPAGGPVPLAAERATLDEAYRQRLADLSALCRQLNLPTQAEATVAWFPPRDPRRQYLRRTTLRRWCNNGTRG